MKYLVSTVLFILVFVLPIGSWFYLKTGLDFRKEALTSLEVKGNITDALKINRNLLKGKTSLIELKSIDHKQRALLFDQFKEAYTFQYLAPNNVGILDSNFIAPLRYDVLDSTYGDVSFILVDTALNIRNSYVVNEKADLERLVTELSILLPKKAPKDLKLKK